MYFCVVLGWFLGWSFCYVCVLCIGCCHPNVSLTICGNATCVKQLPGKSLLYGEPLDRMHRLSAYHIILRKILQTHCWVAMTECMLHMWYDKAKKRKFSPLLLKVCCFPCMWVCHYFFPWYVVCIYSSLFLNLTVNYPIHRNCLCQEYKTPHDKTLFHF